MDIVIVMLGIWAILQVCIAVWGLGLLNNNCQNLSLYSRLRTYLVMSAVAATIFFAVLMCNEFCHEGRDETSGFTVFVTMVTSLTILILSFMIKGDIDDCASSTDNYKLVLSYVGALPSGIAFAYSIGMAYTWFSRFKEQRGVKTKELQARRELARQQKEKAREEQLARQQEKAEEAARQAAAIRKEREAKAAEKAAKQKQQLEEATERAKKAAREKAEAQRKARGELTPDEIIEAAQEKQKRAAIEKAEREVSKWEQEIAKNRDDSEIVAYGAKLKEAREKLKKAREGEQERPRFPFFGG